MAVKRVTRAVLYAVVAAASALVIVVFLVDPESDCKQNCGRASFLKLASLMAWFFAWEVGLLMFLHGCVTDPSKEARGYVPIVSAAILYCVNSFVILWITMAVFKGLVSTSHANTNISSFNATSKVEIEDIQSVKYTFHSSFMLFTVIAFCVTSLILCAIMYAPRHGVQYKPQSKKKNIVKIGCKTISTIEKELERKIETPEKVQLQS